jgi:hypothetical protein
VSKTKDHIFIFSSVVLVSQTKYAFEVIATQGYQVVFEEILLLIFSCSMYVVANTRK